MHAPNRVFHNSNFSRISAGVLAGLLVLAASHAPRVVRAQDASSSKKSKSASAGILVSEEATAKEVGLPIYPGAKPHKDPSDDSPAAQLGLWGGAFGFKLVVLKLESADAPEKVAAFYRKALAKYGPVLDCGNPPAAPAGKDNAAKLSCGDDKPDPGGQLFKSGTKEKQHLVSIKPLATGANFQLLYVEAHGENHEAM
jgi:hypothetical protein